MKILECSRCGSKELLENEEYVVCAYCQSKFIPEADDKRPRTAVIDVRSDIQTLLKKCVDDPDNRRRYANLILDIDPSNSEAMKFIR